MKFFSRLPMSYCDRPIVRCCRSYGMKLVRYPPHSRSPWKNRWRTSMALPFCCAEQALLCHRL